jgi:hypothetical protein
MGAADKPQRKEQEMDKDKKPIHPQEQQPVPSNLFVPLSSRDQMVAELKKEFPNITDEELEAYGV